MEVVLNKLGNQPELKSVESLFDAVQKAKTILQTPLAQCNAAERRLACLDCFKLSLASGRPKFAAIAFEGIQLLLRDHHSLGSETGTPEGHSRAEQLLSLFSAIPQWPNAGIQCQALTLLVQLTSSTEISLKLKEVSKAVEICKQTFDTAIDESTSVRPAARAALTQLLNSYVQNRLVLAENGDSAEIGALMDVTALLGDLVARMGKAVEEALAPLDKAESKGVQKKPAQPLLLPLDALFSVLSALEPEQLERHQPLFNALKSELLPVVICHLHGSAKSTVISSDVGTAKRIGSLLKRASRQSTDTVPATSSAGIALEGAETARSFYQVVEQLLRLFGPMALANQQPEWLSPNEILFLLEELWCSALLAPPVAKRAEAVRLVKRLCGTKSSFGQLLQLSAASGTNSFWLLLIECLEECCTGGEQKMAVDSLRSLNALFFAVAQIVSDGNEESATEFCHEFYSKLAKYEKSIEHGIAEIDEDADKENAKLGNRRRSSAVPQPIPPQPDPTVKLFMDAFAAQYPNWEQCETASELDERIQQFTLAISSKMNAILCTDCGKGLRKFRRKQSGESTPEDSDEENDDDGKELTNGMPENGLSLSELELYSIVIAALMEMAKQGSAEWIKQRDNQANQINNEAFPISNAENNQNSGSFYSIQYKHLLQGILKFIREQPLDQSEVNIPNINKSLNFFASDPLTLAEGMEERAQKRLLLQRWLRSLLHNCWGSILRLLGQFPVRKSVVEEGKYANVEAISSVVPLAIQLGMSSELYWLLEYIGEQVCVLEELREAVRRSAKRKEDAKPARSFCSRAEILAMQVLMENAVPALGIAPGAAKHVIRCIQFLWELERWHFKLAKATIDAIYEPPSLPVPVSKSGQNSPIGQLVGSTLPNMSELTSTELARLMDQFLAVIDRFFADVPSVLCLDSFSALLRAIANANEDNLHYSDGMAPTESSAQLLQRMCQLLCAQSNALLFIKINGISKVKEHLIQCALSNRIPPEINRRTVDGLQEVLNALMLWEWGEPLASKDERHRVCLLQGFDALLFGHFSRILEANSEESKTCTVETCLQIGQVLVSFVEQMPELIGSGWPLLFSAVKLLFQRGFGADSVVNNEKLIDSLIPQAIEVLEKFLAIKQPTLLIASFSHFANALLYCAGLVCGTASLEENDPLMDQVINLLIRAECVLLDYLFGSAIPLSALPRGFIKLAESILEREWHKFGQQDRKRAIAEGEDYLQLLADLKTEINQIASTGDEAVHPLLRQWLERTEEMPNSPCSSFTAQPWHHLSVPTDRVVVENVLGMMKMMMACILPSPLIATPRRTRMALHMVEFLHKASAEIGPKFGIFCACSSILASLQHAISLPQTVASAKALKQWIGIICTHPSITDLLTKTNEEEDEQKWRICLLNRLLELAIRCVAKGGTLSLAGCALLRRLCICFHGKSTQSESILCANSIWLANRYSLFPIRMLVGQFFVNSTDFSGDLGQMKVSYRLGLDAAEVEERVDNVQQLANQVFTLEGQNQQNQVPRGDSTDKDGAQSTEKDTSNAHFPAKFAYLFLFESNNGDGVKKLSMGLDELVDSLLCQQLLVQLAAEQLFRDGQRCAQILGPLLATLHATLIICAQLEQRPGLKSLLQKLTGLPTRANLWTLCMSATHALIQFEIGQESDEEEGRMKRIVQLLMDFEGFIRDKTRIKGPSLDQAENNCAKNKDTARQASRANPFICQQRSLDSNKSVGTKRAEAAKVRALAFKKLLNLLREDLQKTPIELQQPLAAEMQKLVLLDYAEEEEEQKSKEIIEEFIKQLEK